MLLSEAHFYVFKLTKWPGIFSGHKILHILYIFHALNSSRNIVRLLYWRIKYVTPIVGIMRSHIGRGSSSVAFLHIRNPLWQHGKQWSREFSWLFKKSDYLEGLTGWEPSLTHTLQLLSFCGQYGTSSLAGGRMCREFGTMFSGLRQFPRIWAENPDIQDCGQSHPFCVFSREHSARILVSVVVSTESSNYRQEAEGRGVVWAMELESGRALNTVLALHKVAKMLAGALKKYFIGSKNTSFGWRGEDCRASEGWDTKGEMQSGVVVYTCNPSSWGTK